MPRGRYLQRALRGAVPPEPVAMPAKVAGQAPQKQAFDPARHDPATYSKYAQTVQGHMDAALAEDRPHFVVGGKEVYFPWAPVTLLRPSARMTPYQAQFQVPLSFNKLDFRDYLWHVYGLRALSVTTQIKWSKWDHKSMARHRTPQVKKMIIDMEQPFVWPQEDREALDSHRLASTLAFKNYDLEMSEKQGSDRKVPTKVFAGVLGPYPDAPTTYASRDARRRLENDKRRAEKQQARAQEDELVRRFLKL